MDLLRLLLLSFIASLVGYQTSYFRGWLILRIPTADSISSDLAANARKSLRTVLSNPKEHHYAGTLYVLRFSTKYKTLRQRFIAPEVVGALMVALDYTLSHSEKLLQLVVDCLCNLLDDGVFC